METLPQIQSPGFPCPLQDAPPPPLSLHCSTTTQPFRHGESPLLAFEPRYEEPSASFSADAPPPPLFQVDSVLLSSARDGRESRPSLSLSVTTAVHQAANLSSTTFPIAHESITTYCHRDVRPPPYSADPNVHPGRYQPQTPQTHYACTFEGVPIPAVPPHASTVADSARFPATFEEAGLDSIAGAPLFETALPPPQMPMQQLSVYPVSCLPAWAVPPQVPEEQGSAHQSRKDAVSIRSKARSYTKIFVGQLPTSGDLEAWLGDLFAPYGVHEVQVRRNGARPSAFVWCKSREMAEAAIKDYDGFKHHDADHPLCVEPANACTW